jgi:MFS family permease
MSRPSLAARLPFYYGWVVVGVVFVTIGLGVSARTAFSLLFPPILDAFHWDRSVAAGAFSFGFLVSAPLSPLLGHLMDRQGPVVVMELGAVLTAAGMLLTGFATAPWHIYLSLGMLVAAGSVCLGYTGQSLFLPNWFVRRRGLAMGIAYAGVGVAAVTVLPWLEGLILADGWRSACKAMGVLVLVALVPLSLLLRRRPEDLGLLPDGDGGAAERGRPSLDPAEDWKLARALRAPRFWWLAVGYFCALFVWYAVQVHQTKYLIEIGFRPQLAAWALGLVSLIAIPGQIAIGHLSDRIGRAWAWTIGNLGFALCYACLLALRGRPDPALLYLMVGTQGFLGYGLIVGLGSIPAEIFPGRQYGAIFGTLMLGSILGGAAGPWVTGLVHDLTGSYAPAFLISIGGCAVSTVAIWVAAPRRSPGIDLTGSRRSALR